MLNLFQEYQAQMRPFFDVLGSILSRDPLQVYDIAIPE